MWDSRVPFDQFETFRTGQRVWQPFVDGEVGLSHRFRSDDAYEAVALYNGEIYNSRQVGNAMNPGVLSASQGASWIWPETLLQV